MHLLISILRIKFTGIYILPQADSFTLLFFLPLSRLAIGPMLNSSADGYYSNFWGAMTEKVRLIYLPLKHDVNANKLFVVIKMSSTIVTVTANHAQTMNQ